VDQKKTLEVQLTEEGAEKGRMRRYAIRRKILRLKKVAKEVLGGIIQRKKKKKKKNKKKKKTREDNVPCPSREEKVRLAVGWGWEMQKKGKASYFQGKSGKEKDTNVRAWMKFTGEEVRRDEKIGKTGPINQKGFLSRAKNFDRWSLPLHHVIDKESRHFGAQKKELTKSLWSAGRKEGRFIEQGGKLSI